MNLKRVRILKDAPRKTGPIVYWMSCDQQINDNWALLFAQTLTVENKQPLLVTFCLVEKFLNATVHLYAKRPSAGCRKPKKEKHPFLFADRRAI